VRVCMHAFLQFLSWLSPRNESPVLVYTTLPILVLSLIFVISLWLWKIITRKENLKMFLRVVAWVFGTSVGGSYAIMMIAPPLFGLGVRDMTLAAVLTVGGGVGILGSLFWAIWKIVELYAEASPELSIWRNWKLFLGTWITALGLSLCWIAVLGVFVNSLICSMLPAA